MAKAHLLFALILAYLLLNGRAVLRVSSGGRGIVPVLEVLIPIVVALLLLFEAGYGSLACLNTRRFRSRWAPYLALTIVLPLFGVLYADYPLRTIVSSLSGIRALSFLVLGCWIARSGTATGRLAGRYVFAAVLAETVLATGQFLHGHGVSNHLLELQYQWDIYSQGSYSEKYIITGRSIGSFINPNELGYWSVIAFWVSLFALRGWYSAAGLTAALLSLVLSQSRGSMFALVGSGSVLLAYLALSGAVIPRRAREIATFCCLSGVLILTLAAAGFQDRFSDSPMLSRFSRGLQVVSEGATADRNAEGRVMAWHQAMIFYSDHLAGTWGEPQYLLGHFMDNDYVRVLLQGSPFYLFALFLAIGAAIWELPHLGQWGRLVSMCWAVIAINAMSANPLNYAATGISWIVLGYYLVLRQQSFALTPSLTPYNNATPLIHHNH